PPKERAQTSATSKANQHSLLTDTTGLEKVNRILSSNYLTEQQCSLFCNKTASLSNASTSSPTLCWCIPTKLTRPWQRRFCITNSTAPRWSNEDRRAKSYHFVFDFGVVLPAFSGGKFACVRVELSSCTRIRPLG